VSATDRLGVRVVVVTGGANGLGRRYCGALAQVGARVVVADVDGDGAADLAGRLNDRLGGKRALGVRVDVTSPEETTGMVDQATSAFGTIDVLVNNAGSYPHVPFERIGYDDWRKVLALNLDSVFLCTRAVVPLMRHHGRGAIVNVATNLVWSGLANMSHYIAAKSGVVGLTKALARELGEYGITVNALAPGAVIPEHRLASEGRATADEIVRYQAVKRPQRPDDLVGAMLFLCSPDAGFISGQVLTVDGGLTMH